MATEKKGVLPHGNGEPGGLAEATFAVTKKDRNDIVTFQGGRDDAFAMVAAPPFKR